MKASPPPHESLGLSFFFFSVSREADPGASPGQPEQNMVLCFDVVC